MQQTEHNTPITDDQVRTQLKRILASAVFSRAARMRRFLNFVVEGRLTGRGHAEDLKESVIGMAVFDRDPDYNPKSDPVVRVEARRLRSKLDEYYEGPGKEDALRIDLPKGSYTPSWSLSTEVNGVFEQRSSGIAALSSLQTEKEIVPRVRWRLIPSLAAVLTLASALSIFLIARAEWRARLFSGKQGTPNAAYIRSLAVLPFRNLSDDAKQDYLIGGLTDEIITELAKSKKLTVISRTSTDSYRGSTKHLPEIARELHVDAVVEGTVESSGNRVRVTAQLIRAATDSHLWAETYERDASDIFALQAEISTDIARQIGVTLTPSEGSISSDRPSSQEAYETYLQGRYFWNKRTLDGLQKSITYYQQAIRLDPKYAKAYAGLGDSYVLLSSYGGPSPSESLRRAQEAAGYALRLDGTLAEAYTVLAAVKIDQDGDWKGATKEFKRALELSPSYPTAHHWYALHLSRLGQHREAEAQIQRALELDPLSLIINTDAGEVFYSARNPDKALVYLGRVLELDPNFAEAHLVLGKVYEEKRDFTKAAAEFALANKLFADAPNVWALQGHALALAGRRSEALEVAHKLEETSKQRYVSGVDIAIVYCGLGDHDQAMKWLEKAYVSRGKGLDIIADPLFDGCRSDSRYQALLKRLQLIR